MARRNAFSCPKCGRPLRQQVSVIVEADAAARSLNKKAIRGRNVTILGVDWGRATWYCTVCPYVLRFGGKMLKPQKKGRP